MMRTAVSFPSVMNSRFNRPVGEINHFRRLLLANFGNSARKSMVCVASAPVATWNLHTTQPYYFAPTYSEVVNLTGLLITKD
jgi:hypothetical protein